MVNWEEGTEEVEKKEGDEPGDDMKETEEGTEKAEQVGKAPSEVPGEAPGVHASMQDAVAMMKHEDGFIWDQWNGRWWVGLPPEQFPPTTETPMEHLSEPEETEPTEPEIKTPENEPEVKTPMKRPAAHEPKAPRKAKKPKSDAEAGDVTWKPLTKTGYKDFVDSCNGCGDKVHDPPDPARQPHDLPKTEPKVIWKPCTPRGVATFTSFFGQAVSPENMTMPELVDYVRSVKDDWSLIPPETPGYVTDVVKYMSLLITKWAVDSVMDFDYWLRLRSGVGKAGKGMKVPKWERT